MELDLSDLLSDWPYEPGKINVRLIQGSDQEPLIQVRLDLGLLQMRTEGRPDGQRPFGYGSLLDYYEAKHDGSAYEPENPDHPDAPAHDLEPDLDLSLSLSNDGSDRFRLSDDDCKLIREEAVQYYHRYIALLVLEDYEGVLRDTTRNLRALDLCHTYAADEDDRAALEQFRPYILMMRSRALASQMLKDDEPKAAMLAIDDGLETLKKCFAETGEAENFENSQEASMLRNMRDALIPKLPVSQGAELQQRITQAIEKENYELAAILRDELKLMGGD